MPPKVRDKELKLAEFADISSAQASHIAALQCSVHPKKFHCPSLVWRSTTTGFLFSPTGMQDKLPWCGEQSRFCLASDRQTWLFSYLLDPHEIVTGILGKSSFFPPAFVSGLPQKRKVTWASLPGQVNSHPSQLKAACLFNLIMRQFTTAEVTAHPRTYEDLGNDLNYCMAVHRFSTARKLCRRHQKQNNS